ncbi:MAG: ribonuclease J, partial [Holosporaceae bacterium]|nr:ribonuclease J [Holosporaceae bacterium]
MKKKHEKKIEINGLNFISVGGCSEIGMNLYAYVLDDQWILVDMGLGFDNTLGRELLVPSPEILIKNKSKIKALFITHSHEDHIGAIPYIWSMVECPIYGRSFAIEMMRDKIKQFNIENDIPFIKVAPGAPISVGDFVVEYIPVAHSTPESSALAIKTPKGLVIHTGDWRLDDEPVLGPKTDEKKLKEFGDSGVTALVCDSTNVFRDKKFGSEKEVRKNLIQIVKKHKKSRILITCFASNLARLESCYIAAKESGRQMVVAGRSLKKIEKVAKLSGYLTTLPAFLDEKKANALNPANVLLVCTGSQGEHNSALAKIVYDTHQNIKLQEGDVVIFSSRVIPGNEKSVLEIQNALTEKGVKIIMDTDYEIHASGHPSREELVYLYDLTRPQVLIPIHGESI